MEELGWQPLGSARQEALELEGSNLKVVGSMVWLGRSNHVIYYHLVISHSHGKSQFLIGKPSINGPFSMAMLNSQRVYRHKLVDVIGK